jgi:ABC-type antimicrobial peptide transport system permease subunit
MSTIDLTANPADTLLDDDLPAPRPGALRIVLHDRRAFFGLVFLAILAIAAVFAPWIAPRMTPTRWIS